VVKSKESGREPITLVELDQDFCQNTFGVGACTASLGPDTKHKCFNTYGTCADKVNFSRGIKTLRFAKSSGVMEKGYAAIPSLSEVSVTPTVLNPGGSNTSASPLGVRSSCQVDLIDHNYTDFLTDPYYDERLDGSAQYGTTNVGPINSLLFGAAATDKVDTGFTYTTEDNLTWEAWVKVTGGRYILSQWLTATQKGLFIQVQEVGGQYGIGGFVDGSNFAFTYYPLRLGEWAHVAVTLSPGTINFYVNGILVHSYNYSSMTWPAIPLIIGNREDNQRVFGGNIAEVRVWEQARTQSEIRSTMQTRLRGDEPGLKIYYTMEDGSGTTLTDLTGNYDGTITGATWDSESFNVPKKVQYSLNIDGSKIHFSNFTFYYWAPWYVSGEAWVKTTKRGYQVILSRGKRDVEFGFDTTNATGTTAIAHYGDGTSGTTGETLSATSTVDIADGEWHHVGFSLDKVAGQALFVIDNWDATTTGGPNLWGSGELPLVIGKAWHFDDYLIGEMREIRFWNAQKTVNDFRSERNQLNSMRGPQVLLAYFPMDTYFPSILKDRSLNNIDATANADSTKISSYFDAIKPSGVAFGIGYDPYEISTFWRKWLARNPFYINRSIRILYGYAGDELNEMQKLHFVIDRIDGPNNAGRVSIKGRDVFALADDDKNQFPKLTKGELRDDIDDVQTTGIKIMGWAAGEYENSGIVRVGDELIEYAGLSFPGGDLELTGAIRGARGSEADSHEAEERVQNCAIITAELCWDIVYDLLINTAKVDPAFVDKAAWDEEGDVWLNQFVLSSIISEPTGVNKLISEIAEQCLFDIWWDEKAQKIRLRSLRAEAGNTSIFNDQANILRNSFEFKEDMSKRVSQVWVFYQRRDPTQSVDDPNNYKQVRVRINPELEAENTYGEPKVKKIYSRWLQTTAQVQDLTTRYLKRFERGTKLLKIRVDAKDGENWTGAILDILSDIIVDEVGNKKRTSFQIISANDVVKGEEIEYNLQGYDFGFAEGIASFWTGELEVNFSALTEPYPDGAWYSDENGKMSDGNDGWVWQ